MIDILKFKLQEFFGPQPYELIMRRSKNPKVHKFLDVIQALRFFLFPVYFSLWVIGFLLAIFELLNNFLEYIYICLIDSRWLPLSWFGLKYEDMIEEYKLLVEPKKNEA